MIEIWIIKVANTAFFDALTRSDIPTTKQREYNIGYYLDETEAIDAVKRNVNDIRDGYNRYAVVFPLTARVPFAICEQHEKETWLEYNHDTKGYDVIPTPITGRWAILS